MHSKSTLQSRGTDFVKTFFESFQFDRNATSSRLGEVKLYRKISEPWETVAVKSISISNSLDQQELKNLHVFYSQNGQFIGTTYNEHPNLTQLYALEVQHERQQADIYLEYCHTTIKEQINLRLQHSLHFSPQELWRTTLSIILAAEFLQSRGEFIGDLRTSRIFLNKKGLVKVAPFMQSVDDITSYQRVAFFGQRDCFLSPEQLQQIKENQIVEITSQRMIKSDVFELGLALIEMATLRDSIEIIDWERYSIKQAVIDVRIDLAIRKYGQLFGDILTKMLLISEQQRVSFSELSSQLSPYAQAIITGVGFEQIPELHAVADFQLKQFNQIKNARNGNITNINNSNIDNSTISNTLSIQNYDKNNKNDRNSQYKLNVMPSVDHSYSDIQTDNQHKSNQTLLDNQNFKSKLETNNQLHQTPGASNLEIAQYRQTSTKIASNNSHSHVLAQEFFENTSQPSYIKVENQGDINNNNNSINIKSIENATQEHNNHLHQFQIENIPVLDKLENNDINNAKQKTMISHPLNNNINARSNKTGQYYVLSQKSSKSDILLDQNQQIPKSYNILNQQMNQIIHTDLFDNDPIQLKKMDLQKANNNNNNSHTKGIENNNTYNLNNSLSNTTFDYNNFVLNTSADNQQPKNLTSQESQIINSFTDRSIDNIKYNNNNPQLNQLLKQSYNQKNLTQPSLSFNNSYNQQNNPFFKPLNNNISQKQQILNHMPISNSNSVNNLNTNTQGHTMLIRSSNNLKNNSFTTIQDLSHSLQQVPLTGQLKPISQVVESKNISYKSTSDLRQIQVPVKRIILNTMLQPTQSYNQLNTSLSQSSSARDLQRHLHSPLVQINLLGEQSQISQRSLRVASNSRSMSPQTILIQQRQIIPPLANSIIINNNPPAKILNLSSQIEQPRSNLIYKPQSISRQPSPIVRFQQLTSTPSPNAKIVSSLNTFYTPQNGNVNVSAHQLFRRDIPLERQPQIGQQQQNQSVIISRQNRHREVLFTEENK